MRSASASKRGAPTAGELAEPHPSPATSLTMQPSESWHRTSCVTGIVLLARPTLTREPFLEARPGDLRVVAAKRRNVRLEARFVEPLEHLMELLAQHDSREEERQPAALDRSSHHAAEGRRDRRVGELVAGDLDGLADEYVGLREGQRGERADVVGADELVWLVG